MESSSTRNHPREITLAGFVYGRYVVIIIIMMMIIIVIIIIIIIIMIIIIEIIIEPSLEKTKNLGFRHKPGCTVSEEGLKFWI